MKNGYVEQLFVFGKYGLIRVKPAKFHFWLEIFPNVFGHIGNLVWVKNLTVTHGIAVEFDIE